jgi:hypothetical protein
MTPSEALEVRRAMHRAVGDLDELCAAVGERLALRAPPGDWQIMRCPSAVRLFLKAGDGHVSRYVWRWRDTDSTIDRLLERGQRKELA